MNIVFARYGIRNGKSHMWKIALNNLLLVCLFALVQQPAQAQVEKKIAESQIERIRSVGPDALKQDKSRRTEVESNKAAVLARKTAQLDGKATRITVGPDAKTIPVSKIKLSKLEQAFEENLRRLGANTFQATTVSRKVAAHSAQSQSGAGFHTNTYAFYNNAQNGGAQAGAAAGSAYSSQTYTGYKSQAGSNVESQHAGNKAATTKSASNSNSHQYPAPPGGGGLGR